MIINNILKGAAFSSKTAELDLRGRLTGGKETVPLVGLIAVGAIGLVVR